jgi:hypothetical protein
MKSFDENAVKRVAAVDSGQESLFLTHPSSPDREEVPSVEGWVALCARAAVEEDPKKLLNLVIEINRLLDARRKRLLDVADGTERK